MSAAGLLPRRETPLPTRDGVGASCVALPPGTWATITDFLVERFPAQSRAVWLDRMDRSEVMDEFGLPVTAQRPYAGQLRIYYYRTLDAEPSIPFDAPILHRDEHLLVVDKPHFLPVIPSGRYLQETVLVRLKRALGVDHIVPIHRIDRDTAGVVLFSLQPQTRDSYHALFRRRLVHKTYEAVAPVHAALQFPLTRSSRIAASAHFMQQCEVSGPPNAITQVEMIRRRGAMAHYRLRPLTGQRHQLRVHMAALGIPIVWDGLYPRLTPERQPDYGQPLQLLARSIEFSDPLSGRLRRFESRRVLKLVESDGAP